MELIDRYLQAVKFWLPEAQQDDIIAELSEDLRSEVEDKKTELQRDLSQAELESILRQRGRPMLVAARYQPQQHLIGPILFPVYWFVLKVSLLSCLIPSFLTWLLTVMLSKSGPPSGGAMVGMLWGTLWTAALLTFAVVTVVFAIIERQKTHGKFLEDWKPSTLPPVRVGRDPRKIPRSQSIAELVCAPIILGFWAADPGKFPVAWGPQLERLGFATAWGPIWQDFREHYYLPVLALIIVGAGVSCVNLIRPYWTRSRLGIRAAVNLFIGAMLLYMLRSHLAEVQTQWIQMTGQNPAVSKIEAVANWVNIGMAISIFSVGLICGFQGLLEAVRILRWREGVNPDR